MGAAAAKPLKIRFQEAKRGQQIVGQSAASVLCLLKTHHADLRASDIKPPRLTRRHRRGPRQQIAPQHKDSSSLALYLPRWVGRNDAVDDVVKLGSNDRDYRRFFFATFFATFFGARGGRTLRAAPRLPRLPVASFLSAAAVERLLRAELR